VNGGPPGDLYIFVRVQEHAVFKREESELFCDIPITFAQAALGASVEVQALDGEPAKLTIPEGTQPGTSFRIRNKGVPHLRHKGRGDMHVTVRVVVPGKLNAEQKKLLEQFARTLPADAEAQLKDRSVKGRLRDLLG
jgi:molecular chaperone DnaJ